MGGNNNRKISKCVLKDPNHSDNAKNHRDCWAFHHNFSQCNYCQSRTDEESCVKVDNCGWCFLGDGSGVCIEGFRVPYYPSEWDETKVCIDWRYGPDPITRTRTAISTTKDTTHHTETKSNDHITTSPDYGPTSTVGVLGMLVGFIFGGLIGVGIVTVFKIMAARSGVQEHSLQDPTAGFESEKK